jgi:phosphoribosylglycinamide formyltransferase 1
MNTKFPIVVLISGNGSNLQAIMDAIKSKLWDIEIKAVISDKADAHGLIRAKNAGIKTYVLEKTQNQSAQEYNEDLLRTIESFEPQLIVLAGFMKILSAEFVVHFSGKLINIHPSLLPNYKGFNTHQRVIEAGDTTHGCTVHFVSPELDSGATIAQMECEVTSDDTAETLQKKVQKLEHTLLPDVIMRIAEGQIALAKD